MTTPVEKLIADAKWRDIKEFPKVGGEYLLMGEGFFWVDFWRECSNGDAYWEDGGDIEPTHFRPIPDDRCADALKLAVAALRQADDYFTALGKYADDRGYTRGLIKQALQQINDIAEGKE